MRLFRRLLLCLVVGVTAFGAVGWMLRPNASWEVEVPKDAKFVYGTSRTRVDPIWLAFLLESRGSARGAFLAMAPENGAVRWTLRTPPDFALTGDVVRRADGRMLVNGRKDGQTWFAIVDPKRCQCDLERTFDGQWQPVAEGDRAWRIVSMRGGFKVVVRRIEDGGVAVELPFPQGYSGFKHTAVDVSPDGKTLAICESIKDRPGDGFEIWNVEEKRLVGRYDLLEKRADDSRIQAVTPDFRDSRVLWIQGEVESSQKLRNQIWNFDVALGEYCFDSSPEPPPSDPPFMTREHETGDGVSIWTAYYPGGGPCGWFSVFRGEQQIREWRKVPYGFITETFFLIDGDGVDAGLAVEPVPGRDEFVAEVWAPPLGDSLPESLAALLAERFNVYKIQKRFVWHDWKTNVWRDVGCPDGDIDTLIREGAFLCLRKTDDRTVLQSWPLRPRDPKWPALGIAIACAAGTWRLCARRYRRRMRLASVGAA